MNTTIENTQAIKPILSEVKHCLGILYSELLKRLVLFGSQARGDAHEDSNVDILIVLKDPIDILQRPTNW